MTAMHYHLETRSWDAARALDRTVQKYLLEPIEVQKDFAAFCKPFSVGVLPSRDLPSPGGAVDVVPLARVASLEDRTAARDEPSPPDPTLFAKFDVLYHEHRQLSGRHRRFYLFGGMVPERVRIDLVVDASEGFTQMLHRYLMHAELSLINRRTVSYATFTAETGEHRPTTAAQFAELVNTLAGEEYPDLHVTVNSRDIRHEGVGTYTICNLLAHGPIPEVVAFRRTMLRDGLPAGINEEEITFEERAPERRRK